MSVELAVIAAAAVFFAWGLACERLARVWPAQSRPRRGAALRGVLLAVTAAAGAGAVVWRSELPAWATLVYLGLLALLVLLAATDLEHRLLPHAALDPLIIGAVAFVPFNPAVGWSSAVLGAIAAVTFLGIVGLVIRGGIALGDLYLAAPLGLMLGFPGAFTALLVAALLSGLVSGLLVVSGRLGMKSYVPFGPFLVAGALVALLTGPELADHAVVATSLVRR